MKRDLAKEELRRQQPTFLERAKRVGYVCPRCGNGSGDSGTGITFIEPGHQTGDGRILKGNSWGCQRCDLREDIIGLWKISKGVTDDRQAFQELYDYYSISIDEDEPKTKKVTQRELHNMDNTTQATQVDYTEFFKKAHSLIGDTDYTKRRGLTEKTIDRFNLGYIANWKHPKTEGMSYIKPKPVLIVPTSNHSYLARDTRSEIPEADQPFKKQKVSNSIFNLRAIWEAQKPIFIVEGEIDAMSIYEVDGEAVGLGSISMVGAFLKATKNSKPKQALILALDNDPKEESREQVKKALKELKEGLTDQGVSFYEVDIVKLYKGAKDANEALVADKEAFRKAVREAESQAEDLANQELQKAKEEYKKTSTAHYLQGFINGIAESVDTPDIPTGFPKLDKILDGGLYEGLYILGAISSLGKSTFILQVADQLAEAGKDVLIISLEMARNELISKSISRHTLIDVLENDRDMGLAKTARGITAGKRYKEYSQEEKDLIRSSIEAYSQYADKVYIHEGVGDLGVNEVRELVEKHVELTGNKPIVIIDYLQILAPADVRATDKQNTDNAVKELKRISRDYKIPVIGISSFNRENYSKKLNMSAFKESGNIEYSADALLGLQLKRTGESDFDVDKEKAKDPREVELFVLKQRNGETGKSIGYNYYPRFNYFKEV